MPRYFEFRPDPSDPGLLGAPVYHGSPAPKLEFDGIRVNGNEVPLLNPGIVESFHRAMVDGQRLIRRDGQGFDCVAFALLMSGVNLAQVVGRRQSTFKPEFDEGTEIADTTAQDCLLALGSWPHWSDEVVYSHTIVPAHTPTEPLYIHKLGDEGPICLSGLQLAQRIMGASRAARILSMTVYRRRREVARWHHRSA